MLGSSRTSFEAARQALAGRANVGRATSDDLLAASTVLAGAPALRGALSDSGTDPAARAALARSVFADQVDPAAAEVIADAATRRWNSGADVVEAIEGLGFEAALINAEASGRLDDVEDELFRVDRMIAGDDGLRQALSDPAVAATAKIALVDDLLSGKVDDITAALVRHLIAHPRGRQIGEALTALVDQSARRREHLLARIKVAAPITADQERRLATALGRIYHREVDLEIDVDPEVLGGVVVRIGDEVIDGSVAHRLDQVRRRIAGA